MIGKISNCVDCQLPCLYTSCPYYEVETAVCDLCGEPAVCHMNDLEYCRSCANEELIETFCCLSTKEMAEALGMDFTKYDDV